MGGSVPVVAAVVLGEVVNALVRPGLCQAWLVVPRAVAGFAVVVVTGGDE